MSIPRRAALIVAVFAAGILLLFGFQASQAQSNAAVQAQTEHNTPTPSATEPASWIILDTLPITATEADYGAELYRLVCKSCHGDRGQGLTADWIAQWPPNDQNCWQAKCHHEFIHPQDGFALPHFVPAVIGHNELARFETALDLYEYTRRTMPWHAPGTMLDKEYWQVTSFLLRENELDPGIEPLNPDRAASIRLSPAASPAQAPTATQEPQPTPSPAAVAASLRPVPAFILALIALLVIGGVIALIVRKKP